MADIEIHTGAQIYFRMPHTDFDFKITYLEGCETITTEVINRNDNELHASSSFLIDDGGKPVLCWKGAFEDSKADGQTRFGSELIQFTGSATQQKWQKIQW